MRAQYYLLGLWPAIVNCTQQKATVLKKRGLQVDHKHKNNNKQQQQQQQQQQPLQHSTIIHN